MTCFAEFGNVFNVHAHAFLIDANTSNTPSVKAFKQALADYKSEIIDVSTPRMYQLPGAERAANISFIFYRI